MHSIVVFSSLLVLASSQGWGQESFAPSSNDDSGNNPFASIQGFFEDLGNMINYGGPSFLRNATRQARNDYYKILQNNTLTRQQIQTAVNNWAAANNATAAVTAYNNQKSTEKSQFRANVTTAVQQLPSLISQLNSIDDNLSLTPSQASQQTRQLIRNATQPFLRALVLDVLPPSVSVGSIFFNDDNNNDNSDNDSSEELVVVGV